MKNSLRRLKRKINLGITKYAEQRELRPKNFYSTYHKILKTIETSFTLEHLNACETMVDNFKEMYPNRPDLAITLKTILYDKIRSQRKPL